MDTKLEILDDSLLKNRCVDSVLKRWRGQRQIVVSNAFLFTPGTSVDVWASMYGPLVASLLVDKSDVKANTVTIRGGVPKSVKIGMILITSPEAA